MTIRELSQISTPTKTFQGTSRVAEINKPFQKCKSELLIIFGRVETVKYFC